MTCYSPIFVDGKSPGAGRQGSVRKSVAGTAINVPRYQVPCGRCIGCRIQRARVWAARIVLESKMHANNSFLTLTFDGEHLPDDGSLSKPFVQAWLKRIRHKLPPIRYFLCGEYGDRNNRPHYHCILFGYDFPDRRYWKGSLGHQLFRSAELEGLWPYGYCSIGSCTYESAQYVASYSVKRISGPRAEAHYAGREPEFALMSRMPGLGQAFLDRYQSDIYPGDKLVLSKSGFSAQVPRFFDLKLRQADPELYRAVKDARAAAPWWEMEEYRERVRKADYRHHQERIKRSKPTVKETS